MNLQHLLEQPNPEYDKAVDLIINNCQPFLEQINYNVKNLVLYRGYTNTNKHDQEKFKQGLMIKKKVRTNRKTVDMPNDVTNTMNEMFETYFGHPYRTNALFTIGTLDAGDYGQPYIIFPIGEFSFLWDTESKDMYEGALHIMIEDLGGLENSVHHIQKDKEETQQFLSRQQQIYNQADGRRKDIAAEEISNAKEDLEGYDEELSRITKELKKQQQRVVDHIKNKLSQKNLPRAIKSGHEIMIATDYYYMVPLNHHEHDTKTGEQLLNRLQKRLGK